MQFYERLKQYRKKTGLTQQELAQKIHVSRSAVAKWENGLGLPSDPSDLLFERRADFSRFVRTRIESERIHRRSAEC